MRPRLLRLPVSHYCHKVDWALTDHGVPVDQTVIWFRDLVDILDIHPENTVPVLELEDRLVCGSSAILHWLSGESPLGHVLYPEPAVATWEAWADDTIGPIARRDAYRTLYERPMQYTRNPGVWLAGLAARRLILAIIKSYKGRRFYAQDDLDRPDILTRIDQQLASSRGAFLFGPHKTAADYATAALLEPMLRIRNLRHPALDGLRAYVRRVKPRGSPYRRRFRFSAKTRRRLADKA